MIKTISILSLCLLLAVSVAWAQEEYRSEETSDYNPLFCPDGGLTYNPFLTDVINWTTGTDMPDSVYGSVCAYYNGQLFRSHGRRSNALPYNTADCWAYNPGSNSWTQMATAPTARRMVAAGMMQDGQYLYSVGGRFDATTTVGTNERYNMATNTWETLTPCTPRWAHGGFVVGSYVYVFGGQDATVNLSCQKYDPATNSWSSMANLPVATGWTCGATLNGKGYMIGGSASSALYEYDPTLNTWTAKASMPGVKTYCWAIGSDVANKIYVFGGTAATAPTTDVWVWDGATNTWSTDTPMPGPRNWAGVGTDGLTKTFVLGGFDGSAIYYFNTWVGTMDWANPLAPAAPTGFTVSNNGTQLMASLAWTNPTTTVNGQPLAVIDSLVVLRNNVQIATLFGNPGQAMSMNDNVPAIGQYNYQVTAYNSVGAGVPGNAGAWIGLDVPGAPTGVTATNPAPLQALVSWTAPTAGQHGGYWPPGSWDGQKIYRNAVLIQTLTGTNTSYTDNVPFPGTYTYGVAYYNSSGDGPTTNAAPLFVTGPPLSGSYDIGGGNNDFPTIVAAVTALSGGGLSGAVTFNVYNGTYDGQVNLPNTIPGLSATNTLTIRAATGQNPVVTNTTGTSSTTGNGFYITGADYITIKGLEITNTYYHGIYAIYTGTDSVLYLNIENNYIHDIGATVSAYGMYLYRMKYSNILNNRVQGDYMGIQVYYSQYNLIANNMIYGQDYYGLRTYYGGYNKFYYNSVYLNSSYSTTNYVFYCYNTTGNEIKNNIFYNGGSGSTTKYAFYLAGALATYPITSNYNDLYSPNSSVGYFLGAQATLANWQAATTLDANSISADPNFLSVVAPYNLHINTTTVSPVDGAATPVAEVTVDFDYQTRSTTTPDIGADEFTGAPPADLNVTMTPIAPPIVIPANGGSFNFNATVERVVGPAVPFWAWARNRNPDGTYSGVLLGPVNINPPVGVTVTRQRTQVVPADWQAGVHYYIGYAAPTVGYPATDADSFDWTKSTTADGGPIIWEAANYGEEFPYQVGQSSLPTEFSVVGAYPNPFNPSTTIGFALPEACHVNLTIYDVSGRVVAQVVNGERPAGHHRVTFDGSNLASGMYLYRLTAGSHSAMGKMVMVK